MYSDGTDYLLYHPYMVQYRATVFCNGINWINWISSTTRSEGLEVRPLSSRFLCCVLLALSQNTTNENPSDKLSKAINQSKPRVSFFLACLDRNFVKNTQLWGRFCLWQRQSQQILKQVGSEKGRGFRSCVFGVDWLRKAVK